MKKQLVDFGMQLRKLRLSKNIPIRKLSVASGIDKNQLLNIEKGESDPHYTTLLRLANALGVSVGDLVDVGKSEDALDGQKKE